MATANPTNPPVTEQDHLSDALRAQLVEWSDTLRDTERAGLAAIRQSERDAFVTLLDKLNGFGRLLIDTLAPMAATILSEPVAAITGDKVRQAMARKGSALFVDDDTRKSFPSASTMSRAMVVAKHDTAERRAQWMDATETDDKGNVKRNPLRVQDYVQVIAVVGGESFGNKSAIDWQATLPGARVNPSTRKVSKAGRAPVTIGVMTRKPSERDTDSATTTTDTSVIIPTAWRDLFAMDDAALTAVADDADGFDVSGYSDADKLILARQLLAAIVLSERAAQRVTA